MPSSLKMDPSRTVTLRRSFIADMDRRFKWLAREVRKLVNTDDVFGLKPKTGIAFNVGKRAWEFNTKAQKMAEFKKWLKVQVDSGVLETSKTPPWTSAYVGSAYKKGMTNAYTQVNKMGLYSPGDFFKGTQAQFLKEAFAQPEVIEKVELIYTRSYSDLKAVTATMDQQLSQILARGLVEGTGAGKLAKEMTDKIGVLNRTRARVIARTEIIYAHAEGQLDSYERMGVKEVGVKAEWQTAADA